VKLTTAIDRLCDATAADGRSERTVDSYRSTLRYLVEYLGDLEIDSIDIAQLRQYAADLRTRSERYINNPNVARQKGGLSTYSIASYLRSVKRLFNWLVEEDLLSANPAAKLKIPTPAKREPKAMSMADFARILAAAAGNDEVSTRNRAILILLADTGCRAGGLCRLQIGDVDLARGTVRLTEKGEKTRNIPFSDLTGSALRDWLAVRPAASDGWLFLTMGPRAGGSRLTEEGLKQIMRRLKKKAGVQGHVNPHAFRHAFAREWIRNGGDLATLSRMMGHSDPSVTARFYSVFSDAELVEFHQKYSPLSRNSSSGSALFDDLDMK